MEFVWKIQLFSYWRRRRGLLDWASLPLIMPALVIGKGRENHCVQLPREEVHPRAMTGENTISVGKSPCLRWKFSPLARVACGPKDTRGHFFYQKRADLALSRWAQLGAFSAVALRLNTSEKTEISYIRRFCFAFWDFASSGKSREPLQNPNQLGQQLEILKSKKIEKP